MEGDDDELMASNLRDQIEVHKALSKQLVEEIQNLGDSFELQAVTAEARRMRAERALASLHREQELLACSSRKHTGMVVRWWMSGLLFGWFLCVVLSFAMSPILGFLVLIPSEAVFLLFGYASSAVEMKISTATWKRVARKSEDWGELQHAEAEKESETVIALLLEQEGCAPELPPEESSYGGPVALVAKTAAVVYGATMIVPRAARWLLGYSSTSSSSSSSTSAAVDSKSRTPNASPNSKPKNE